MKYQVKCHNEVNLIGRIVSINRNQKCNNIPAILVRLALPNDENYNYEPNIAYVYFYKCMNNMFRGLRGQAIAISGHIETKYGQKIIADCFAFIKESKIG